MGIERDWYGRDWRVLRSSLVRHCVDNSTEFLRAISSNNEVLASEFSKYWANLLTVTAKRIDVDQTGLWEHALPLLSDDRPLFEQLSKAHDSLSNSSLMSNKSVSEKQAFGQIVRQYIENARRGIRAVESSVSNNKVKTWERLDRISRELAAEDDIVNRCCDDHFHKLSQHVKSNYPNDKNLPRSISTIGDYFYRFSDDCVFISSDAVDGVIGRQESIAEQYFGTKELHALEECISELNANERLLLNKRYDLGLTSHPLPKTGTDIVHTLPQNDAKVSWETVLQKLRLCLESNASVWISGV